MSAFEVYVLVMLDSVGSFLGGISLAGFCVVILWGIFGNASMDSPDFAGMGKRLRLIVIPLCLAFAATIIPNTKQAAAIYLLPKLTNNQEIQELGQDSVKLLRGHLDKWLEELGPQTK